MKGKAWSYNEASSPCFSNIAMLYISYKTKKKESIITRKIKKNYKN
jgi:hypothetical protein